MQLQRQSFSNRERETVKQIGETIVEGAKEPAQRESVKTKYEDLVEKAEDYKSEEAFADDTDLYSTLQADMIEEALEPQLLAQDAIRSMDFNLGQGFDSIQIPSGNQLSAVDLNSDGTLSEDTTSYDSITVSIGWVGVRTTFSHQIVEKAAVDLLAFRLEQAGRAIARRVDSDILEQIEKAGTKGDAEYGDNSNYVYTGGSDATYDNVIDAIQTGIENQAMLDMAIAAPDVWGALHKDADVKDVLAFTATAEGDFSMVQNFGPLRLMTSSQVTADKALLVDSDRTAMFVDASPVETFDGRVNEAAQFEILAVKGYGVKILQPKSVVVLHESSEPA
jgi:HK97 family phage major capsid protein